MNPHPGFRLLAGMPALLAIGDFQMSATLCRLPASGSNLSVQRPCDAQSNSDTGHVYPIWITPHVLALVCWLVIVIEACTRPRWLNHTPGRPSCQRLP